MIEESSPYFKYLKEQETLIRDKLYSWGDDFLYNDEKRRNLKVAEKFSSQYFDEYMRMLKSIQDLDGYHANKIICNFILEHHEKSKANNPKAPDPVILAKLKKIDDDANKPKKRVYDGYEFKLPDDVGKDQDWHEYFPEVVLFVHKCLEKYQKAPYDGLRDEYYLNIANKMAFEWVKHNKHLNLFQMHLYIKENRDFERIEIAFGLYYDCFFYKQGKNYDVFQYEDIEADFPGITQDVEVDNSVLLSFTDNPIPSTLDFSRMIQKVPRELRPYGGTKMAQFFVKEKPKKKEKTEKQLQREEVDFNFSCSLIDWYDEFGSPSDTSRNSARNFFLKKKWRTEHPEYFSRESKWAFHSNLDLKIAIEFRRYFESLEPKKRYPRPRKERADIYKNCDNQSIQNEAERIDELNSFIHENQKELTKTSCHSLKFCTKKKQDLINKLLSDYKLQLEYYVKLIIDGKAPERKHLPAKEIPDYIFTHTAWKQVTFDNAVDMVKTWKKNRKYTTPPTIKSPNILLDQRLFTHIKTDNNQLPILLSLTNLLSKSSNYHLNQFIINLLSTINFNQFSTFNQFIKIHLPYFKPNQHKSQSLLIPIKYHKQYHKFNEKTNCTLKDTIQLTSDSINLLFALKIPKVKTDIYTTKKDKIYRYTPGVIISGNNSIVHKALESVYKELKKLPRVMDVKKNIDSVIEYRNNVINRCVNEIFNEHRLLDKVNTIYIEPLKPLVRRDRNGKLIGSSTGYLNSWIYTQIVRKLKTLAEENGVLCCNVPSSCGVDSTFSDIIICDRRRAYQENLPMLRDLLEVKASKCGYMTYEYQKVDKGKNFDEHMRKTPNSNYYFDQKKLHELKKFLIV